MISCQRRFSIQVSKLFGKDNLFLFKLLFLDEDTYVTISMTSRHFQLEKGGRVIHKNIDVNIDELQTTLFSLSVNPRLRQQHDDSFNRRQDIHGFFILVLQSFLNPSLSKFTLADVSVLVHSQFSASVKSKIFLLAERKLRSLC